MGRGWILIGCGVHPGALLTAEQSELWDRLGGGCVSIGAPGAGTDVVDVEGNYGRWLGAIEADFVILRPDFYVAATETTVFGPFFLDTAPEIPLGGGAAGGAAGQPCWVEGTVCDTDGAPIPNARIEVWECDEDRPARSVGVPKRRFTTQFAE